MSPTQWANGAVEEAEPVARPVNFARCLSLEPSQVEATGPPGNSRSANFWGGAGEILLGAGLRKAAGFSFIEVLVIGALLAILMLGVVPQLFMPDDLDIELAARQVAADLGLARRLAIAGHANYEALFSPAGGPYTSYTIGLQGGGAEPDFPKSFAPGLVVTGIDQIVFAPAGNAAPAGIITMTFARGVATADVQVISATGRVRVVGP